MLFESLNLSQFLSHVFSFFVCLFASLFIRFCLFVFVVLGLCVSVLGVGAEEGARGWVV